MNFEFTPLLTDLAPEITALVTHRGFNTCHYAGSSAAEAAEGRRLLAEKLGISTDHIVIPTQTHSCRVALPGEPLDSTDALVTDRHGTALCINTADCLPLVMADTEAGVIGAAHCGWRGTVAGIASATLRSMIKLGADPGRIRAAMGPCICTDCFEVGEEVANQFPDTAVIRISGEKPHVDLAAAVTMQLTMLGVLPKNITMPVACSMHSDTFYSVRRQGRDLTSRTLTVIMQR